MTLVELLSRAGSTTPGASEVVTVVRARPGAPGPAATPEGGAPSDAQRINLKDLQTGVVTHVVELHDGDTVYVGKADEVFVFGEVKAPGAYPMRSATTVLQALSLAGGVTSAGAIGRIRIMRTVNGVKRELSAKLTDLVQPGDTITVPERFF
jgi:polysaccharide export outer membrane protein